MKPKSIGKSTTVDVRNGPRRQVTDYLQNMKSRRCNERERVVVEQRRESRPSDLENAKFSF